MTVDRDFVLREILQDCSHLLKRVGHGRLEPVFNGSVQVARSQVDQESFVVQIDNHGPLFGRPLLGGSQFGRKSVFVPRSGWIAYIYTLANFMTYILSH
jgi:hypothetical protein